jgi:hypothetical protein
VHVIQFLNSLLRAPYVEIVEASLPETARHCSSLVSPQRQLIRIPPPAFSSQRTRHALLQSLHHRRWIPHLRLADQQMNVFRHHHVAHQRELVTGPHLIENPQENVPLLRTTQQRAAPITTTRDEMQMALAITALQSILQSHHSKPAPFANPAKSAAPAKEGSKSQGDSKSLQRQLPQWYHPHSSRVKKKMHSDAKDGPPATS